MAGLKSRPFKAKTDAALTTKIDAATPQRQMQHSIDAVTSRRRMQLVHFADARGDVAAEVEGWADGVAVGPSAFSKDVIEGMVPGGIELRAYADVFHQGKLHSTADTVGTGPIHQWRMLHEHIRNADGKRVLRIWMRRGRKAEGGKAGADKERHLGGVAIVELRSGREGLCGCRQGNVEAVAGGKQP